MTTATFNKQRVIDAATIALQKAKELTNACRVAYEKRSWMRKNFLIIEQEFLLLLHAKDSENKVRGILHIAQCCDGDGVTMDYDDMRLIEINKKEMVG